MAKMVRVNAVLDVERKRNLFYKLLDDELSFTEWLRRRIDEYTGKRLKGQRKGKEA